MNRRRFLTAGLSFLGLTGAGAAYWTRRWDYIVIHHSAGGRGDIPFLQQVHRQRQAGDPIDAIPYHFVVGNGKGLKDGEVASDWRQRWHIWGAHVSGRNFDRNFRGLGICLIGNFEKYPPTQKQYAATVRLTKSLMEQYSIPASHVSGHGHTENESTKCPGRHFPMRKFMRDIA